jgi:hypothetical protein
VISSISGSTTSYARRLTTTPPSDWASHDGSCEVINTTLGESTPVPCTGTQITVYLQEGANRFVVRANARDGSRSVDSAARSAFGPVERDPTCRTGRICQTPFGNNRLIEITPTTPVTDPIGPAGAGLGMLALAVLLRIRVRGARPHPRPPAAGQGPPPTEETG